MFHNNLKGRVAVITGGGGVLCSAFAKDLAALGAEEVCVWMGVAIETQITLFDTEGEDCAARIEQVECVVDGCSREGGHVGRQGRVDFVHCGVGAVSEQIVHHCYSLYRGPYAVAFEIFSCLCNHFFNCFVFSCSFVLGFRVAVLLTLHFVIVTNLNPLQKYKQFPKLQNFLIIFLLLYFF